MLIDKSLEFADGLAIGGDTGRRLLGDVADLTTARDIGNLGGGMPMYLVIQVSTTATSAGDATVQFEFVSDAQAAIADDGTATVHAATAAIPVADLTAGKTLLIPLPLEAPEYEQFIGLIANVGTAALTAGAVNAFVTSDAQRWQAYPDALDAV